MSQLRKYVLQWVGLLICAASFVQAAPFAKTIRFQQPDGTAIELWGAGDEFRAVFETLDGYTVMFDPAAKTYFYAAVSADGTQLVSTGLEVGKANPQALGIAQHLRISDEAARLQARARFDKWDLGMQVTARWNARKKALRVAEALLADGPVQLSPPAYTTTNQKMGLTLLIDFSDDPATVPRADIVDYCNGDAYTGNGNNGSVKKYFLDNSNGLLIYSNTVTAYIRMVKPKSYYNNTSKDCGTQAREMITDAVAIMRAMPNYTSTILPTFSNITVDASGNIAACNVFYAGGNGGVWTFGLWPHSSSVSALPLSTGGKKITKYQVTNIGSSLAIDTFCHENGHMLCDFPDIYDYDYDSKGGAGNFCLMDYGGPGNNPVQICAYLKRAAGWATTVDLTYTSNVSATLTATQGAVDFNRFYRFAKPGTPTEYFLFENRQKSGRDLSLPSAGIAIWHIDELGNKDNQSMVFNTTHKNYECTLEQADNLWHFQKNVNAGDEKDLYYSGNSAAAYSGQFLDSSAPSARWWDGTESKLEARDFSESGPIMTFSVVPRPPVMLTIGALPPGRVGTAYSYTLGAAGGVEPYAWTLVEGPLPAGVNFNSDGTISGIPEEATTASFSVAVLGANGVAATNQLSLLIRPVFTAPLTETFENGGFLPDGWIQEFVTNSVAWVYLNGGEKGHPVAAHGGSYNACLAVTSTNRAVTRLVSPRIDFGPSPKAAQLTFWHYMEQFADDQDNLRVYYKTTTNGTWQLIATYTTSISQWRQQTVTLPNPSSTYYIAFEGTAKYGYGIYVDDVYVCDPTPPLAITTLSPLPNAIIDVPYSQSLTAVGGTPPYSFARISGTLPTGMTLSTNGVISGTASAVGTNGFVVLVTDFYGMSATLGLSLSVTLPKVDLLYETFEHDGQMPYNWTQEYVTNNIRWRFKSGGGDDNIGDFNLPTYAHSGSYNAVLWMSTRDDNKTRLITPRIDLSTVSANTRLTFWLCMIADRTNQDELRVFYRTSLEGAWNLLATYTQDVPNWTIKTLTLPNPTGTYYLAFEGNARFGQGVCIDDVRISDESSAPVITTTTLLPNGFVNVPYSQALTAVGGCPAYTWGAVSNTLPLGLTLSQAGVISGTPVITSLTTFQVWVTGADGYAATNLFSLQVKHLPGFPFNETFDASNPSAGWTQQVVTGSARWEFRSGSPRGTPAAAHSGLTNACLYYNDLYTFHITKLVSPMLNLGTATPNTRLSFWMCMARDADQDQLRVYYKTNSAASWNLLNTYTKEVTAWTNIVLNLPSSTPTYYIAFEGWAYFGKGVCIDDVAITGDFMSPYDSWKTNAFKVAVTNVLVSGDTADPDGDGIANALEYAMGFDPTIPSTVGLPFGGVTAGYLTLSFRMDKTAFDAGVVYEVEACTDLILRDWTKAYVSEQSPRADSNTWWQAVFQHDVPVTNAPQRFLRLKVTLP